MKVDGDRYKEGLLLLGLTFPLTLLAAFFTLITFGIQYDNPLIFILLFFLLIVYYNIIRLKVRLYQLNRLMYLKTNSIRVAVFALDVALSLVMLLVKNLVFALIILGLWFITAFIMARIDNRPGGRDPDVIDIDERGNVKK